MAIPELVNGAERPSSGLDLWIQELRIRASLLDPESPWRDPALYGHQLTSDDFWILAGRWETFCPRPTPARVHPRLGWTQGELTPSNPLGFVPSTMERLQRDGRPKVLFYGDSYVMGVASEENWLPNQLDAAFPAIDVLNLGVGGYGTDQMHLLLRETAELVDRPSLIVMGVMPFSMDRAGLSVRDYQKPLLRVRSDGELEVTNVPIEPDPSRFFRRSRLSFRSYLRASQRHEAPGQALPDGSATHGVNRAILDANAQIARSLGAELLYVVFHDHAQLLRPDPRSRFLLDELAARGIAALDTAPVLRERAELDGTDAEEFYERGHHNDAGNRVLARALVARVKEALDRCGVDAA